MNARIATPKAEGFLRAFLESYKDCRESYTEPEWELVWSASEVWNCLMPWTTNRPELVRESSESVLAKVAEKLGFDYWEREPLGLDGAFYPKGGKVDYGFPFPILVAIEHENDRTGFISEVQNSCPFVALSRSESHTFWAIRILVSGWPYSGSKPSGSSSELPNS